MNKTTIFLISFLFTTQILNGQLPAPTIKWSKCFGGSKEDQASTIFQAKDGGHIIAGNSQSINGNIPSDSNKLIWVCKLDKYNNVEWQKRYGNINTGLINIKPFSTGGYVLFASNYTTGGDVSAIIGGGDYWIVRINDTGKIIWEKSYGGTDLESGYCNFLVEQDGNIIIGGDTRSNDVDVKGHHGSVGVEDMWIFKVDSMGKMIWSKCFGGSSEDGAQQIIATKDGGYLAIGSTRSYNGDVVGLHGSGGYLDTWMVKLDNNGKLQWTKCYGGSLDDGAEDVKQTKDGGYILVGGSQSKDGDSKKKYYANDPTDPRTPLNPDAWIFKIDSIGNIEWSKCYGGNSGEVAKKIIITAKEEYIIGGYSFSEDGELINRKNGIFWLFKLDTKGNVIWSTTVGGNPIFYDSYFHDMCINSDNTISIATSTRSIGGDVKDNNDTTLLYNDAWFVTFNPELLPITIVQNEPLLIYPNPASSAVYIATQNIKEIRLIDALGRVYFRTKTDNTNNAGFTYIPLTYIANGTYIVQAIDNEGVVRTGKLVVTK